MARGEIWALFSPQVSPLLFLKIFSNRVKLDSRPSARPLTSLGNVALASLHGPLGSPTRNDDEPRLLIERADNRIQRLIPILQADDGVQSSSHSPRPILDQSSPSLSPCQPCPTKGLLDADLGIPLLVLAVHQWTETLSALLTGKWQWKPTPSSDRQCWQLSEMNYHRDLKGVLLYSCAFLVV